MIHIGENWAFIDYIKNGIPHNHRELPVVNEGDIFISCNFSRWESYTKIFNNINDLVFFNCNLNSVDIKNTWLLDDQCSYVQIDWGEEEILKHVIQLNIKPLKNPKVLKESDKQRIKQILKDSESLLSDNDKRIYKKELTNG